MHKIPLEFLVPFVIVTALLCIASAMFAVYVIYRYQQKQLAYTKEMGTLKAAFENTLLQAQLEMQEQTFANISREIHDNIGQKLTLAKLQLNTLNTGLPLQTGQQVGSAVDIIGEALNGLSDISRSMSSDMVLANGLIKAVEHEAEQLAKTGLYKTKVDITGQSVFLDGNKELVLFRIIQEALNNIVKHSQASFINIRLHFNNQHLHVDINDNGTGFNTEQTGFGTGLSNIKKRTGLLKGNCRIQSVPGIGTEINIEIPYK